MNKFLIPWDTIESRYNELSDQVSSNLLESSNRHGVQKELSYLSTLLAKHKEIERLEQEYQLVVSQSTQNTDSELAQLFEEELQSLNSLLSKEYEALDKLMFPPDELNSRSVFLEIRAGAGGQEASLFAGDLLRMYTNYALKHNWQVSVVNTSTTDLGGYREIILHIEGKNVYGHLKYESRGSQSTKSASNRNIWENTYFNGYCGSIARS